MLHQLALAAATALAIHSALPASAQPAVAGVAHEPQFVNGGVTKEEADYLRVQARSYPLEITFSRSTGAGNAFAADVQVVVRDERGNAVLSIPSADPIVLARLAPGRYTIEATLEGRARSAEVTVGDGHQKVGITW